MPDLHTLLAGGLVALLVGILAWGGKQLMAGVLRGVGQVSATKMLGARKVGKRDLRRYRSQVSEKDARHPLGFMQIEVNIDSVYVPLQGGPAQAPAQDVYQEIRQASRCVVLASAGAGKSMLLRRSLMNWAHNPSELTRTPVLVDLHEYNDPDRTLTELLVSRLSRRGISSAKAQRFVMNALNKGRLTLLLDGLDEVSIARRSQVVAEILELAETFPQTQVIVTCRDAVYHRDLSPAFAQEVRIAELDDARIRRFLRLWFENSPLTLTRSVGRDVHEVTSHVDRLMIDLRSAPPIMRLARNPLMLAMIASLESTDPGLGPSVSHLRADFYDSIIDHMLRRDKDVHRFGAVTTYRGGHKRVALAAIAFAAQSGEGQSSDNRSVPEKVALAKIADVLTDLRLAPDQHAQPFLDEIVTRSELLIRVSDNTLTFPHLTLQEYLSAEHVGGNVDRLFDLYQHDPDRWRETVKLWCGADRDSTSLIMRVFAGPERDRILALECLAEAKQVEASFADSVMDYFQGRMQEPESQGTFVINAFGAVVARGGALGERALAFLQTLAESGGGRNSGRESAIQALASSRLMDATAILTRLPDTPAARAALRSIGEIAVPALADRAAKGNLSAVDDIAAIATPSAAIALAGLIHDDSPAAIRAAWRFASLIADPDVMDHLEGGPELPESATTLAWVSEPFDKAPGGGSQLIARLAKLLSDSDVADVPTDLSPIDVRLAIPLACVPMSEKIELHSARRAMLRAVGQEDSEFRHISRLTVGRYLEDGNPVAGEVADSILNSIPNSRIEKRIISTRPTSFRIAAARALMYDRFECGRPAWKHVNDRIIVLSRPLSWLLRLVGAMLSALMLGGAFAIVARLAGWFHFVFGPFWLAWCIVAILAVAGLAATVAEKSQVGTKFEDVAMWTLVASVFIGVVSSLIYSAALLGRFVQLYWAIIIVAGVPVALALLFALKDRNERSLKNPLRGLLQSAHFGVGRTSVIANIGPK